MGHCVTLTTCSNACPSVHLNSSSMSVSDLVLDNAFRKLITFAVPALSEISSAYFSFDINPTISSSDFCVIIA